MPVARSAGPSASSSSGGMSTQITPSTPASCAASANQSRAAPSHRVGIAHQDQRDVGVARAERLGDGEDVGGGRARGEAAQVGRLDRGAVGHRIGERHAELDHVRAALDERVEDRRAVGPGRRR